MFQNKRFLAVIPARSGSKGIRDKNIKELNGKPLMGYTIDACKKTGLFDDILVSTDSGLYQQIAAKLGATIPFLRPSHLSGDEAATSDVIVHALTEMKRIGKEYDYFMLLQPTSPLRDEKHILESVSLLFEKQADSVISVCPFDCMCYLSVAITEGGEIKVPEFLKNQIRRQDVKSGFRINGAIYLTSVPSYLKCRNFYSGKTFPYFMDPIHSLDIDDIYEFYLAKLLIQNGPVLPLS
ncbi:acylneuraminate cytidylyltransferase family protein [Clostridium boliviensis]|uniref:Acylneuraminate cytidylyltransferase family protein n=1 Tax=Clostridium boliviensis TaxID=318465 RepID=A0ABU4GK34_9CLOT|nr:acylneuraminate cytidylyltransferase family protein [Clostridium boliviensis]MDW2796632.1 acylneuraminate cytidylyltransferase family protein [Clostridium boliviensis]